MRRGDLFAQFALRAEGEDVANIVAFPAERPAEGKTAGGVPASEVIVFPRTNIRVLRRLWGLPEYGLLVAGPDGRAVGALSDDSPR